MNPTILLRADLGQDIRDRPFLIPSFFRTLMELIRDRISTLNDQKARTVGRERKREFDKRLWQLRRGYWMEEFDFDDIIELWRLNCPEIFEEYEASRRFLDFSDPLSFTEITSYSIWFTMRPTKRFGEEYTTGNREFPVRVKGDAGTIRSGIDRFFNTRKKVADIRQRAKALQKKQK